MINNNVISSSSPCVCIPYAHNADWSFIKSRFESAFGTRCIKRVDIINKRNKKKSVI